MSTQEIVTQLRISGWGDSAERSEMQLVLSRWAYVSGIEPEIACKSLAIEIGGCTIKADANTDMELLAKVCRTLMQLCSV